MASRVRLASSRLSCLVKVSPIVTTTLCVSIDSSAVSSTARNSASVDRVCSTRIREHKLAVVQLCSTHRAKQL